jgi:hypothetical protein
MNIYQEHIHILEKIIEDFLHLHIPDGFHQSFANGTFEGQMSLIKNEPLGDLYGMLDSAYILFTLGWLPEKTNGDSRKIWANQILLCQDDDGWFSKRNFRGHSPEHATAYAIGALRLLEIESNEDYLGQIKPIAAIKPIMTDRIAFERWLNVLDFRFSPKSILQKKLGWHYIWRGSHVGGGIPAAIGMMKEFAEQWWPGQLDVEQLFNWYFEWLDTHANPQTGYWQRAFWNLLYRKPTLIDMGGAVHFLWIYESLGRPFPFPQAIVESTLSLQKEDGLYKDHPFCIDLDGNFCMIRAYLQLPEEQQNQYHERVYRAANRNFEAIVQRLTERPLHEIYSDSHGLPGALAALVECTKLPDFQYTEALNGWQHPLDKVWWL